MLRAGSLTTSCLIQSPNTGTDELGQPLEGWTDYDATWCNVKHLHGSEAIPMGAHNFLWPSRKGLGV